MVLSAWYGRFHLCTAIDSDLNGQLCYQRRKVRSNGLYACPRLVKEGASRVGDEIVNTNNTREIEVFENFAGQPRSVRTKERKNEDIAYDLVWTEACLDYATLYCIHTKIDSDLNGQLCYQRRKGRSNGLYACPRLVKEGASRVGDEIVNTNNTREIEVFENFAGQPRSVRTKERKNEDIAYDLVSTEACLDYATLYFIHTKIDSDLNGQLCYQHRKVRSNGLYACPRLVNEVASRAGHEIVKKNNTRVIEVLEKITTATLCTKERKKQTDKQRMRRERKRKKKEDVAYDFQLQNTLYDTERYVPMVCMP